MADGVGIPGPPDEPGSFQSQGDSDRLRNYLKRKYSLVHVPSRHKAVRWLSEARRRKDDGLPTEAAGWEAALSVFPYEAKEHALYIEGSVDLWLS